MVTVHNQPVHRRVGFHTALAAIAAAALALRVVYTLAAAPDLVGFHDYHFYHHIAGVIADGRGYVDPFELKLGRVMPTAFHPPLWPLLLAAPSKLGIGTVIGHKLVGCAVGAVTVAITGLVGRRIGGDRTGLVAAAVIALLPLQVIADNSLMAEPL